MPHDEISKSHEDNLSILAGLRTRPAPEKLIKVHRCNDAATKSASDYRCDCDEYISQSAANALLQSGDAEWLTVDRGGKPYTRRDSIVIWSTRDQLEQIAASREENRKAAARQKAVAKILKTFRDKLTETENEQWSDDHIIAAFETKDPAFMELPFMDGADAKQKLLSATNKEIAQSSFVQKIADNARIYAAFIGAALAYWNKVKLTVDHGLSDTKGQYMTDADRGKGELVSGGYGVDKIAEIDGIRSAQREMFRSAHDSGGLENNGCKKRNLANFVPGSGGLEVTIEKGEIVEADPTYKPGHDPIRYEEGDPEKAQRLREKWLQDQYKDEKS
jgi:hypothetical protein